MNAAESLDIGHVALGCVDEGGVKPAASRKENYVYWVK